MIYRHRISLAFYPKLNQMTTVISVFGDVDSPVRRAFLVWSVVSGLFVLSLPALYHLFIGTSKTLAILAVATVGLYGIGDCILLGYSVSIRMKALGIYRLGSII